MKARYVYGGNLAKPPFSITYTILFSCDILRLSFLIEALNVLDILEGGIHNAYLSAPKKRKYFSTLVTNRNLNK